MPRRDVWTWAERMAALGLYLAASVGVLGRPLLGRFASAYVGAGADPTLSMWCLVWWPYALVHGLNPLETPLVWAPVGFNLTWTTPIPGPSLLAAPLTGTIGPIATYNLLVLLAPALAAWTAYRLCRHVTGACWPALLGGAIFGFSAYEVTHALSHLHAILICLVPYCVHVALLHVEGGLSTRALLVRATAALLGQFLCSAEIFATLSVVGGVVFLLAGVVVPREQRRRLAATAAAFAAAYLLALLVVSPYVFHMVAHGIPTSPLHPLDHYSADLLNVVVPTPVMWLGHLRPILRLALRTYLGQLGEPTAYVGIPLLVIVERFRRAQGGLAAGRLLLMSTGVMVLAACGPTLHVAGVPLLPLPWRLVAHVPLLQHALPVRLTMYVFLGLALIVALWWRVDDGPRWLKRALVLASVLAAWPNPLAAVAVTRATTPALFREGLSRALVPGENVLVVPAQQNGRSMLWQASTGMAFRMVVGHVGVGPPAAFAPWRDLLGALQVGIPPSPGDEASLREFLAVHQVTAILVVLDDEFIKRSRAPSRERWEHFFSGLGVTPREVGGVLVYRLEPSKFVVKKS